MFNQTYPPPPSQTSLQVEELSSLTLDTDCSNIKNVALSRDQSYGFDIVVMKITLKIYNVILKLLSPPYDMGHICCQASKIKIISIIYEDHSMELVTNRNILLSNINK